MVGVLGPPRVTVAATTAVWPPTLELVADGQAQAPLERYLTEDRRWLAAQSAGQLAAPPPDSLAAVRTWLDAAMAPVVSATGTPEVAPATGLRDLLSLLRDRWLGRGYLAAEVTRAVSADDIESVAKITITTGPLYHVGSIEVGGEEFNGREHLLATVLPRTGDRFAPERWEAAANRLLAGAGEQGYPFARWVLEDVAIDPERATVDIKARLLVGHRAYLGPITSDLEDGRGQRFLVRASGLHRGQRFQHSQLERARQRLLARDLYASVDAPTVYLTSAVDSVGVHWTVQPRRRANRFSVILGLSRNEEGRSKLSGQVDLRLPNLAGTGRQLEVAWSDDGRQLTRFGLYYLEPLIFGTPLDTDIRVASEVLTGQYTRLTLENHWQLPIVGYWGLEVGAGWDRTTYPTGRLERTGRLRGRAAFFHRRGDRAISGWHGYAAIETARREATHRTDADQDQTSELGEVTIQRILDANVGGEQWLGRVLSLAGRATFRQLSGGQEPAPLAEQFRFGGAQTLRGYLEQQFHGETVAYGSIELRLGRPQRSRVYTFVDVGYFEFETLTEVAGNIVRLKQEGSPVGFGVGLEVITPVGDISLAIGFPERVDFQDAKLHVLLLEAF
jgi:outer membrane protein insertion porin family